jgi:hypothetical protein
MGLDRSVTALGFYSDMKVGESFEAPATAGRLDFSRAAVTDRHAIGLENDRNLPPSFGKAQHIGKRLFVLEHIAVFKRHFPAREGLPGRSGVGSKILAEDNDGFSHRALPMKQKTAVIRKIGALRLNCK